MKDFVWSAVFCGMGLLAALAWGAHHVIQIQREQRALAVDERRAQQSALSLNQKINPTALAAKDDKGTWGTVKGKVVLAGDGEIPELKEINVDKDQNHCLEKGKLFNEELVVNKKNRGVRYVFVWLAPEKDGTPLKNTIHPDLKEIKDKEVTIDQPHCQFVPHALGLREGQILLAKNSSPIAHNVHWTGWVTENPGGNVIIPAKGEYKIEDLVAGDRPVEVKCDIHGWMRAWVRVFDHPYFAVTDENGSFEIKLAPAGKYRLVAWQEKGWVGDKEGRPIEIKADGKTDAGSIEMKLPENN